MFELPSHLHPMSVHFPVALFLTALGLDILSFLLKKESLHKTAVHIYIIATLIAPLVVKTGILEAEKLSLSHPVLDKHRFYALLTMWVSLASLPILYVLKTKCIKYFRALFIVFLIAISGFISMTSEKGGQMVYEYGVGVEE